MATLIERETDSIVASKQLGRSSDDITRKHYIERQAGSGQQGRIGPIRRIASRRGKGRLVSACRPLFCPVTAGFGGVSVQREADWTFTFPDDFRPFGRLLVVYGRTWTFTPVTVGDKTAMPGPETPLLAWPLVAPGDIG